MKAVLPIALFVLLAMAGCSVTTSTGSTPEEPKKEATKTEGATEPGPEAKKPEGGDEKKPEAAADSPFKNVIVTDDKDGKDAKESVAGTAEKIYIKFTLAAKKGDKFSAALFLDKTEDPKLEGKVKDGEKEMPADGEGEGDFSFIKPDSGWPAGEYHIELSLNGEKKESVKFSVK